MGGRSRDLVRVEVLPDTLKPGCISVHGRLLRITGLQKLLMNVKTTGNRNWLFESKDGGETWKDLEWSIRGSLGSIAFGRDGRIWAMAAGNRMQAYTP